jgi:hypothetical protein
MGAERIREFDLHQVKNAGFGAFSAHVPALPAIVSRIQIGLPATPDGSATAHTERPKLATVLAEGYNLDCLRRDLLAALTVAIVALPLSMAIAVASAVSPERGLYAAVIGGFLVSALGGSRYQIGGPVGACRRPRPNSVSTDSCSRCSSPASC